MSVLDILYTLLIMPLQLMFEALYMMTNSIIGNPGLSIVALSLMMNFLVLPLYMRADAMQEHERDMEAKLRDGVAHIKKTFKGDEKVMMLQTYYRQNNYKPTDVIKGSVSLFLEIPFFISAYMFLSHLDLIKGVSFWFISDLGSPDGLLTIAGLSINVLPFVMTGINLVSCVLFTRGMPTKTKVQLYGMALFFLVFLYSSPAGLVFYWTLNNVFALVKTIFYKLKNPKKVLIILAAVVGVLLMAYGLLFYNGNGSWKKTALVVGLGVICVAPLVISQVKKALKIKPLKIDKDPNLKTFVAGALFLTLLVGCVIPSSVISSSPQEFVTLTNFVHPDWYVVSAFCLAAGTFLVWFGVFYWLCSREAKVVFEVGIWVLCGVALLDYMVFVNNFGVLSSNLQFTSDVFFGAKDILVNLACVVVAGVVLALVYLKLPKVAPTILAIAAIAFVGMTGVNVVTINSSIDEMASQESGSQQDSPSFTLSTTGQNVVVMMLDRGMNLSIPYIMNEKPELKEIFSGFTYYDNVISFGGFTNVATPALYGGYEYTPTEINARSDELLVDKQNEALKVMPVLFDKNGYEVTVCDPTYAGYTWIPDLSIYDDYPDIATYITNGAFSDEALVERGIADNKRNFFCYGITCIMPEVARTALYDRGNYNNSRSGSQVIYDTVTADGLDPSFMDSYTVLENLSAMTKITDDGTNTFLMFSNDATHQPSLLQEGDYVPQDHVDNSSYEAENSDRFTVDGVELSVDTNVKMAHYQVNMASILQVAEWITYLKENGVYDNTRIIIVSDHGAGQGHLPDTSLDDGSYSMLNIEYYYPVLMVKDFNASSFEVSSEFMTNADVPTLATSNLGFDAINYFTGSKIDNSEKTAHDQLIFGSELWDTTENAGTTFIEDGVWLTVHGDVRIKSNWVLVEDLRK